MLPGMMRSGACTRLMSSPILKPLASMTGRTYLSMVPGLTVDSITTVAPFGQTFITSLTAATT